GTDAGQVPVVPLPVLLATSWHRPIVPPSLPKEAMRSSVALKSPARMKSPAGHWSAIHARSDRQRSMASSRGATACTATIVGPVPSTGIATALGTELVLLEPSREEAITEYSPSFAEMRIVVCHACGPLATSGRMFT